MNEKLLPRKLGTAFQTPGSVMIFNLMEDELVNTQSRSDTLFDRYVLTSEDFLHLGPAIQDIVIHAEGQNFTAAFRYKVVLEYRYRFGPWLVQDLLANTISPQYQISPPFSDRTRFGMEIRLVLYASVAPGGVGTVNESGSMNVAAAIRFFDGS